LVGFDDFALADMLDPSVTVIAQDPRAIGCRAAELLFERMSGGNGAAGSDVVRTNASRQHVVPSRLIVRESSRIAPPS
ncbi:MAG TPA: substrate-binding domain-containing protein, partial [Candidatus Nanopelagicales bacterium]|nr:substrate-binding domain-containing protein [Candidatus Nanopelagicales bacterium]